MMTPLVIGAAFQLVGFIVVFGLVFLIFSSVGSKKNLFKGESCKHFFTKEGLLSWKGRRNRRAFILFSSFVAVASSFSGILILLFFGNDMLMMEMANSGFLKATVEFNVVNAWIGNVLNIMSGVIIGFLGFTNMCKRFHDFNYSGVIIGFLWGLWIIGSVAIYFMNKVFRFNFQQFFLENEIAQYLNIGISITVGIIGFILFVISIFKKGTVGPNKYGPDPLIEVGNVEKVEEEK
ncbi:MAG: DUF805 domain-containing protein [Phascolarctobacterium sp.]|nr:DUF805 domain-containing protein [Candidatus Phascolarctobacterium caballi]